MQTNGGRAFICSVGAAPKVQLVNLAPNPSFSFKAFSCNGQGFDEPNQLSVDSRLAEAVKENLGARNNREIGELTFDYYVKAEDIDG